MSKYVFPLSSAQFAKTDGRICPSCGARESVHRDSVIDVDEDFATQECCCDECNANWTAVFRLFGYEDLMTVKLKYGSNDHESA